MVSPLRLGLRRDITLFLLSLAVFFVCIIALLIVALQMAVGRAEQTTRAQWEMAADAIAARLESSDLDSRSTVESTLLWARSQYGAAAASVRRGAEVQTSGEAHGDMTLLTRRIGDTTLELAFDESPLRTHRRVFYGITFVCFGAAIVTTLLLILLVPKIVGPIEGMLEQAKRVEGQTEPSGDEAAYLIDTFRRTIERLESRETELRDLHERERLRADELERISATLTRSLSSGFLSVGPGGRIAEINGAACEMLGIDVDAEVSGRPLESIIPAPLSTIIRQSLDESLAFTRTEVRQPAGKEIVELGLTTVPLRGRSDEPIGVIALFTNLTPIRDLEERVRALQTLADLGEMSAGVAHEFRNSLSTIAGYLKLARRQTPPEAVDAKLRAAEEESGRLAEAVSALLNFARPFALDVQQLDLGELAHSAVARAGIDGDVPITTDIERAPMQGDVSLLSRAIENGLRNAIESVKAKGSGAVRVRVRREPLPTIEISDDGLGIDPADVPRLFLPFQSQRAGGFGLGLSLVRKIALLHHGSVDLTGAPGKGATLTMTFAQP